MRYLGLFLFLVFPYFVLAGSIYIVPNSGEFEINKNFRLIVYIDSDQEINAVGGKIIFDKNYLRVISISDKDSIISLWAVKPTFNNQTGEIIFEGVRLNKPFKGKKGKIIEINFRGLEAVDQTKIQFNNVQILAADGQGINVFEKSLGGNYKIYKKAIEYSQPEELELPEISKSTLPRPIIFSPSHPIQEKWYRNNNVRLEWRLPDNVEKIKLVLSFNAEAIPNIIYEPPINYKTIDKLEDGIHYFKLQFVNKQTVSEIATYKIMIDTTPPQLEIKELPRKFIYEAPKFQVIADDNLSGINYFQIYLNNKLVTSTQDKILDLENYNLKPGKYLLGIKAFDLAGNFDYRTINFEIEEREVLTEAKITATKKDIIEINKNILILTSILIILALILIWFYEKNRLLRNEIDEKIHKIEEFAHKSLIALKKDLEKQLDILEKRKGKEELIEEEKKLIEHLKHHIKYIDSVLEKNIKDIEDLLK